MTYLLKKGSGHATPKYGMLALEYFKLKELEKRRLLEWLVSLLPLKQLVRSSVGGALPALRKEHPCLQGGGMLRGTGRNWRCWPPRSPSSPHLALILLSDDTFPDHPLFIRPSTRTLGFTLSRVFISFWRSVSLKTYNKSVCVYFSLVILGSQRSSWEPKQGTGIFFCLLYMCILLWEIS